MSNFSQLLRSDTLPIAVLALILLEAFALVSWHRRSGRGPRPALTLSFLGAGFAFMAALYFHRRDDGSYLGFAIAMLASLILHVWHVAQLSRR